MPFRQAIHRTREGHFELRLSREERRLLRELPAELRSLLEGDSAFRAGLVDVLAEHDDPLLAAYLADDLELLNHNR